jgi:aspartyl-tRNA(Asn)/glutamyl-tRNA(Gln) amidotransferase subunit B
VTSPGSCTLPARRSRNRVTPEALSQLIDLIEDGTVSGKTAKDVFEDVFNTGKMPSQVVEAAGLTQITSGDAIAESVARVIQDNRKAVDDYRGGKEEAIKFLVGQVMRETRGRAKPEVITQVLREKLGARP